MASLWLLGTGGTVVLMASLALLLSGFSSSSMLFEDGDLKSSAVSPQALGRLLLKRLREGDLSEVAQLGLTKEEWTRHVWPVSAANRPGSNFTPDFVWGLDAVRSRLDLSVTLSRYGGKEFQLIRVRFRKGIRDYEEFRLHRDARVEVGLPDGGKRELKLFSSVFERNGEFKIFSFKTDN